jgi:hypothetical protein
VYTPGRNCLKDAIWIAINDHIREWVRVERDRRTQPSEAVIDSQNVKSAMFAHEELGYAPGKKIIDRKRFMTVDTLGLVL